MSKPNSHYLDLQQQPDQFPTHFMPASFWEALGRVVATFGFLELVLGRAAYALKATTPLPEYTTEKQLDELVAQWSENLTSYLTDPLGGLIPAYEASIRHRDGHISEDDGILIKRLIEAKKLRNALCHASWSPSRKADFATPWFVNAKLEKLETEVDFDFLKRTQKHVAELCCLVVSTVTARGLQFPGSNGPGTPVRQNEVTPPSPVSPPPAPPRSP